MTEEMVKAEAEKFKAFLDYNTFLKNEKEIMVILSMPRDPLNTEEEIEIMKSIRSHTQFVPLEESDQILNCFKDDKRYPSMKKAFEDMKQMIARCKEDDKFLEIVTRAALLCLLYRQIENLIEEHCGHILKPLFALEEKLYAPMPVDKEKFTDKMLKTIHFYSEPKVPWLDEKMIAYTLVDLFEDACGMFGCGDFYELKEKVPTLQLTDDSTEIQYFRREYTKDSEVFTVDTFKDLMQSSGFVRAVAVERFYDLLDQLADRWRSADIIAALDAEDQIYTLPTEWAVNYVAKLEEQFLSEE